MSKTEINHALAKHLHINLQEATRLVSNAVRDGILTEMNIPWKGPGRPPKRYIIMRHASDIDSEIRELF